MKAIRIHSYGKSSELKVEETETPKVGPTDVLVKIHDAGINPIDWKIRAGQMKDFRPATFPLTMGQDFAGEAVEVGQKVRNFGVGARVFGFAEGSYAEFASVSEDKMAEMPKSLDFDRAASLPTPGCSALQILKKLSLSNGQKILIHGAAGAVGSLALQLAKFEGATVYATALSEDTAYLKEIGADKIIDFKNERFEEFVQNFDAVIDLVGGETLQRSYQCVKKEGVVISSVGPVNEAEAKSLGVKAIQFMMEPNSEDLKEIARLADQGKIKPRVSSFMPFEKAGEAQELSETGKSHGKVILQVTQ